MVADEEERVVFWIDHMERSYELLARTSRHRPCDSHFDVRQGVGSYRRNQQL